MRQKILYLLFIFITLSACSSSTGLLSNSKRSARRTAPSGKYRNPTFFSRVNPFQGGAKAKLDRYKRKKKKLFKKKHRQSGTFRKAKKPGRNFGLKRTISRSRLKSSGSRIRSGGGGGRKKNKNLFKTRKK